MHPAETALVAACRRDDAHRVAATRRLNRAAPDTTPVRARVRRRLVAWGEQLQSPTARPATTRVAA